MPKQLSGNFIVRLGPELHFDLQQESKRQGVSLNQLVKRKLLNKSSGPPDVVQFIKSFYGDRILGLVLFGSQARGTATANSDIDLLIVLKKDSILNRVLYHEWEANFSEDIFKQFSPQFVLLPEKLDNLGSLWLEVGLEGEVMIDKNNLLRQKLSEIKQQIASGKYRRKMSHGQYYWIRNEIEHAK